MHITYDDACACFARMTPAEQAAVVVEARAKGLDIPDLVAMGIEGVLREGDRATRLVLRCQHRNAKRPSVVLSIV